MVSARGCLIARADSSLPADARPTRKLRAAGITIAGTADWTRRRRMSLVRRDYDPLDGFRSRARGSCVRRVAGPPIVAGKLETRFSRRADDDRASLDPAAILSRLAHQRAERRCDARNFHLSHEAVKVARWTTVSDSR